MSDFVTIHEVGPRDGLQNERGQISVGKKVALIKSLIDAGLKHIEVGSFVSANWVPQMADTDLVTAALPHNRDIQYDVLIPNMRGWEGFQTATKIGHFGIAVFISASEGFSKANLNCSIEESVARLEPVVREAMKSNVPVRGYVSCVTDCPYDGAVAPDAVVSAAKHLRQLSDMPISLGDTIGQGTPETVTAMLRAVLKEVPASDLAGHFHDTHGQAIENIDAAIALGLRAFDSAAGGLGGCPYAPGAPGNVATEAVVAHLHRNGYRTGINTEKLALSAVQALSIRKEAREKPEN